MSAHRLRVPATAPIADARGFASRTLIGWMDRVTDALTKTGPTNLGFTPGASAGTITSDTGDDATIAAVDSTNAGLMLPAQNDKLAGIEAGATLNVGALADLDTVAAVHIDDGAVTEPKLDTVDTPADGEVLAFEASSGRFRWIPPPTGATDLAFAAAATSGAVTSSTGSDATIPLASSLNGDAGLIGPADKSKIAINLEKARAYGTIGDGAAVAAARSAAGTQRPIILDGGDYDANETTNLYGSAFRDALGMQFLLGTSGSPTLRHEPLLWLEKVTASNRNTISTAWDQGGIYASLEKVSGDAYSAAITGFGRQSGGSGDVVGIHGRGEGHAAGASIFGIWSYAKLHSGASGAMIGHEINLDNATGGNPSHPGTAYRGLVVVTADGSGPCNMGIDVGGQGGTNGFYTGLRVRQNGVVPTSTAGFDTELIMLQGASLSSNRYGGIKFQTGYFEYGIDLEAATEIANQAAIVLGTADGGIKWGARTSSRYIIGDNAGTITFNNYGLVVTGSIAQALSTQSATLGNSAALWLKNDDKIVWGADKGSIRYLAANTSAAFINFQNYNLAVNGTQVVGTRKTGWGTFTGSSQKTGFDTSTVNAQQLAERFVALITDLRNHGLIS